MKIRSRKDAKIVRTGEWNDDYPDHGGVKGELCVEVLTDGGTKYWDSPRGFPANHPNGKENRYVTNVQEIEPVDHDEYLNQQDILCDFTEYCCHRICGQLNESELLSPDQILQKYTEEEIYSCLGYTDLIRFLKEHDEP